MLFFSASLVLPPVLAPLLRLLPDSNAKEYLHNTLIGERNPATPSLLSITAFTGLGVAAVHYNTIIHPYTLADNRHYVFYVFRHLRRHPGIRYAVVPVYVFSAWATIQALGTVPIARKEQAQKREKSRSIAANEERKPCQASFILAWIVATLLSVVTAPLVEPRYFIIPWLLWRLHVSSIAASQSPVSAAGKGNYDMRLVFETVWHLAINAVTGYIFLYRGFTWPSQPDSVQRFLY